MILSVRDTAVLMGKSERQIRYMLRQGQIPGRKPGKSWIIRRLDLLRTFPELNDEQDARLQALREVTEAARSFGATRFQMLRKVQIPLAIPTIMAGVNQCIMLSLSMMQA